MDLDPEKEQQIKVLVEYQTSKRCVTAQCLRDLPSCITAALKSSFGLDVTLKVLPITQVGEVAVDVNGSHLMQRWSEEWKSFVDVVSLVEVANGDRINIIPIPSVSPVD